MNDRCDDPPDRVRLIRGETDRFEGLLQLLIIALIIDLRHFAAFALIDVVVVLGSEMKTVVLKIRFTVQQLIERMKIPFA